MKITYKTNQVMFGSLPVGTVFVCKGRTYLKIQKAADYTAVDLEDGRLVILGDSPITYYDSELIISEAK